MKTVENKIKERSGAIFSDSARAELKDIFREVLREELGSILTNGNQTGAHQQSEHYLRVEEVAAILNVDKRWIYRQAKRWPFARHLSRKKLVVSESGLRRWIAATRPEKK